MEMEPTSVPVPEAVTTDLVTEPLVLGLEVVPTGQEAKLSASVWERRLLSKQLDFQSRFQVAKRMNLQFQLLRPLLLRWTFQFRRVLLPAIEPTALVSEESAIPAVEELLSQESMPLDVEKVVPTIVPEVTTLIAAVAHSEVLIVDWVVEPIPSSSFPAVTEGSSWWKLFS